MTLTVDAPYVRNYESGAAILTQSCLSGVRRAWPTFPNEGSRMQTTLVGSAERQRSFEEAIAKVREYRLLPKNWDSYGGKPASDKAANYAASLLARLSVIPEVSAPFVSPITTGVYLEWNCGAMDLYLEVDQNSVLIVIREDGKITHSDEDPSFGVELATELITHFHQYAR